MGRMVIALAITGALILPGLANDSTAELRAGGIELVRTDAVQMVRENLYISADEVRVSYVYHNVVDEDVETLVAFPMPAIKIDPFGDVNIPNRDSENFLNFEVWVDGEAVTPDMHHRATSYGIDVTNELKKLGVPLLAYQGGANEALAGLDENVLADLEARGVIYIERWESDGEQKSVPLANWELHSTYAWRMVFPAHSEVKVEHRYTPAPAGASGMLNFDYENGTFDAAYREKYCIDESFEAGVRNRLAGDGDNAAYIWEQNLSYILVTANNWAGAISQFTLTVDKGYEDSLVSFCGEGVTKIGPTTFEMTAEDYYPQRDLDILFLRYEG